MSGVSGGSREGERRRQKLVGKVTGKDMEAMDIFTFFIFSHFSLFLLCPSSDLARSALASYAWEQINEGEIHCGVFIFKASFQSHAERLQLEGESRLSAAIKMSPSVSVMRDDHVRDPQPHLC